ncbi:MAG: glucose-6-phosphate isomerase family protein [Erysipelotrichaceae bacterium]|nr:glucose-6-phosphate isomerase family protein [Erysipelotrichaceae bacterium]
MKENLIRMPQAIQHLDQGARVESENLQTSDKRYCDLKELYLDKEAAAAKTDVAYHVVDNFCMEANQKGGMYWGYTYMEPGDVNGECNMTRGYFYTDKDCYEYFFGFGGEGYIIFWDGKDDYFVEKVFPGSVHFMDAKYARRIVNTSDTMLTVAMCWGYTNGADYETIRKEGFPIRIFKKENGEIEIREMR